MKDRKKRKFHMRKRTKQLIILFCVLFVSISAGLTISSVRKNSIVSNEAYLNCFNISDEEKEKHKAVIDINGETPNEFAAKVKEANQADTGNESKVLVNAPVGEEEKLSNIVKDMNAVSYDTYTIVRFDNDSDKALFIKNMKSSKYDYQDDGTVQIADIGGYAVPSYSEETTLPVSDTPAKDAHDQGKLLTAVIDTGCGTEADSSVNFTTDSDLDNNGHGTQIAKIIREKSDGKAYILSLKAIGDNGEGSISNVTAAVKYAIEQGADIINMSIIAKDSDNMATFKSVVEDATARSIKVVAAPEQAQPMKKVRMLAARSANLTGSAYAVFNESTGELDFIRSTENHANKSTGSVKSISGNTYTGTIYTDFEANNTPYTTYTFWNPLPWLDIESKVKNVKFIDAIRPLHCNFWFADMKNCTYIDLKKLDTSYTTSMNGMFQSCSSLTSLDVGKFNTAKVTDMAGMFQGCSSLTSLDVSNFDTSNVRDMGYMFTQCRSLTSLDVKTFNTANVTDMAHMFSDCHSLTSLDVTKFDTANVTNMGSMFQKCSSLTSLDVGSFDTTNVKYMNYMFNGCRSLTSLDVKTFNTANVTDMAHMFEGCSSLTSLDLKNFNTTNVTNMSYMFYIWWLPKLSRLTFGPYFQVPSSAENVFPTPTKTFSGKPSTGKWGLGSEHADSSKTADELAEYGATSGALKGTWYAQEQVSATLKVDPNGGTWNNSKSTQTFTQYEGTTKDLGTPAAPSYTATVSFDLNFDPTDPNKEENEAKPHSPTPSSVTLKYVFKNWTVNSGGKGYMEGNVYTFQSTNDTVTANYYFQNMTLPTVTREGYTFLGWYHEAGCVTKVGNAGYTEYKPEKSETLYARWRKDTYTYKDTIDVTDTDTQDTTAESSLLVRKTDTYGTVLTQKGFTIGIYKQNLLGGLGDKVYELRTGEGLYKADGTLVDDTADANGYYELKDPAAGKYVAHEEEAPAGWYMSEDYKFVVAGTSGERVTVELEDSKITKPPYEDVHEVKKDSYGRAITNAMFELRDNTANKVIGSYSVKYYEATKSTDFPDEMYESLQAGHSYTLTETNAPDGFETATYSFDVPRNGTDGLQAISILDPVKTTGQLQIKKVDSTDKPLKGAEFQLFMKDETGTLVPCMIDKASGKWTNAAESDTVVPMKGTTDDGGTITWMNLPLRASFTGSEPDFCKSYYLVETKAPEGYSLTNKVIEIRLDDNAKDKTVTYTVKDGRVTVTLDAGGNGVALFTGIGATILSAALLLVVCAKRKQAE